MADGPANASGPEEREVEAEAIVRKHATLAAAGALIPVPLLDLVAVTAVQLEMLKRLARIYGVPFDPASSRAFVTSLTAGLASSTLARLGGSAVKLLPGVGAVLGGITAVAATAASTYAVGSLFRRLFRERRPIGDLDPSTFQQELASYYEKGLELARSLRKKA